MSGCLPFLITRTLVANRNSEYVLPAKRRPSGLSAMSNIAPRISRLLLMFSTVKYRHVGRRGLCGSNRKNGRIPRPGNPHFSPLDGSSHSLTKQYIIFQGRTNTLLLQIGHYLIREYTRCFFGCRENQFGRQGCFVKVIDTSEALDLSCTCLLVQPLGVPRFTHF